MNYKYKRSFIFIRSCPDIKFYSETTDFMDQLRKVVPTHIYMTSTRQSDNIETISFWYPELKDYDWFTENLYIAGDLKLVFRNAMIYAKNNQLAFCLPSINLQNTPVQQFTRYWYYYLKTPEEKFYDTTPGQKISLKLLRHIVSMPECLYSSTIFDFEHNMKFTENAILNTVSETSLHRRFYRMEKRLFADYRKERQVFNTQHNIKYASAIDTANRYSAYFNLDVIKNIVPESMKNLTINLEL